MEKEMKIVGFYLLFLSLHQLGLTASGQEEPMDELAHLHEQNPSTSQPISVSVNALDLPLLSSSEVAADKWLKRNVLSYLPFKKIFTIVVGNGVVCDGDHEYLLGLVLPSVENLQYSLLKWELLRFIKVSVSLSSNCFNPHPILASGFITYPNSHFQIFNNKLALREFETGKPISRKLSSLGFPSLNSKNPIPHLPSGFINYPRSHFWNFNNQPGLDRSKVSALRNFETGKGANPISRKLSSLSFPSSDSSDPFSSPPEFAPGPEFGYFSFAPDVIPANPPETSAVPPLLCPAAAPAPVKGEDPRAGLWCVAKPTVPDDKLQEAMDYACGEGGADCEDIKPNGSCFSPDNAVAHASYAFNSYWQKTKQNGGSCSFDGTALLINSDPSFLQCRFVLN